ncbi:hypothetical protein COU96_02635 [Candidatus Shapirobacteria bacterium CG10_big_fil_rev_8_21_14_0_10_38_14]|uniref:Glycosyltransferase 2-like domain-containing protein n=1 Tax=Candidatus Shapirobacteria bacterium CG10_big_fil_rev_8_21_14_0_10_38_14 TaxID=1974483 RepID=A0A2M8L505_9BACT|nr:MAG: hypothetical protein COU96_02635 [Candidatus Shapirobacteria bacterium CG10_big_fil_rev_8_21_14_0_10_38_14]
MKKLSVILATFNEEKNIKDCLESVHQLADEIIIVDGSSTDKTVEIASSIGRSASGRKKPEIKILIKNNPPMFHLNKQLAIEKAIGDWILYLDADERVSPKLRQEINQKINAKTKFNGFWIPRKNIIFGKWIRHTGWYPDYQLRLFKNGQAFLPCQSVHEQPKLTGEADYLENFLIHYNYRTISQFVTKLNYLYTENDKKVFLAEGKKISWPDALRWPTAEFLKRFFKQEGYKDGLHGLVLSLLQSFSALVTFAKIWENQEFKKIEPENFLVKIEKEFGPIIKEFKYWFLTSRIKQTKSFFKKNFYRLVRKSP